VRIPKSLNEINVLHIIGSCNRGLYPNDRKMEGNREPKPKLEHIYDSNRTMWWSTQTSSGYTQRSLNMRGCDGKGKGDWAVDKESSWYYARIWSTKRERQIYQQAKKEILGPDLITSTLIAQPVYDMPLVYDHTIP